MWIQESVGASLIDLTDINRPRGVNWKREGGEKGEHDSLKRWPMFLITSTHLTTSHTAWGQPKTQKFTILTCTFILRIYNLPSWNWNLELHHYLRHIISSWQNCIPFERGIMIAFEPRAVTVVVGLQVLHQPNIKASFAGLPRDSENTNVRQIPCISKFELKMRYCGWKL